MPDSPDTDLTAIEKKALELIQAFAENDNQKTEIEPVAFGINAVKIIFVSDENKGATDDLEKQISEIEHVNSVEVIEVRRAID